MNIAAAVLRVFSEWQVRNNNDESNPAPRSTVDHEVIASWVTTQNPVIRRPCKKTRNYPSECLDTGKL